MAEHVDVYTKLVGARQAAREAEGVAHGVGDIGDQAEQAGRQSKRGAAGVDRFGRAAKGSERESRRAGRAFIYARKGIGPLRAGVTGLTGALGFGAGVGLIGALKVMNDEAREAQKTGRATDAALKSTGASSWISAKQISRMATSLSEMAGVDDEVIQKSMNMELTFRNIQNRAGKGNKIFNRAARAALDMAAGFEAAGKSMTPTDAALQLDKALNDPIKGMTRLQRVGITFTKQQTDQVAAFEKAGKTAKAQGVILNEVQKEFGGQARSQADPVKKLNVILRNVAETIGLKLLPYVDKAAAAVGKWVTQVENGTGQGGRFRDQVVRIWNAVKPVVFWFGRAAANVFRFASAHPKLVKIAAAIGGVALALKVLRFGRAISGVTTLLGLLGKVGKTKAGQQAATRIGKALGSGPMGKIGSIAGAGLRAGLMLALVGVGGAIASKFADEFLKKLKSQLPEPFSSAIDVTRFTNPLTSTSAITGGKAGQTINIDPHHIPKFDPNKHDVFGIPIPHRAPRRGNPKLTVPGGLAGLIPHISVPVTVMTPDNKVLGTAVAHATADSSNRR